MADKKRKAQKRKAGASAAGAKDAMTATPFGTPNATDPILVEGDLTPAATPGLVTLEPRKPVTTTTPQLNVTGMTQPGTYVFEVVVVDDLGMVSQPASLSVQVNELAPTPNRG